MHTLDRETLVVLILQPLEIHTTVCYETDLNYGDWLDFLYNLKIQDRLSVFKEWTLLFISLLKYKL